MISEIIERKGNRRVGAVHREGSPRAEFTSALGGDKLHPYAVMNVSDVKFMTPPSLSPLGEGFTPSPGRRG